MKRDRGVALLEALILVVLISLTGAAVLTLTLGGFMGSASISTSQTNKFDALSILSRVYADLAVCDPESDGSFASNPCVSTSDPPPTGENWSLSGDPGTDTYTATITYDLTVGVASSRDVSVGVQWCPTISQYKVGIAPCDAVTPCFPTVTCP